MRLDGAGGLWFLVVIAALLGVKWFDEQRQSGTLGYTVAESKAQPRLGWGTGTQSRSFRAKAGQNIVLDYRADIRRESVLVKVERMEMARIAATWKRRATTLQYWKLTQSGNGQLVLPVPASDLYQVSIGAVLVPFAGDVEVRWRVQ